MTVAEQGSKLRLDPLTFEVLRHRLWYINDEGALTISRVSGSPVATEVFDMNASLMTAAGEIVYIDNFICAQATVLSPLVQFVLEEYAENPGFGPGDIFLCNDPYVSVCHQNCVQVAGPIFWEGELVAWAGASLHAIDVGGPTAGQVQIDAADIFGEQPTIRPIKIVEAGRVRKDVEASYLGNSRLPEMLGLDLRAKIAAVNVIRSRMLDTFREFGAETVKAAMADVVDYTEQRMRARLRELPDGRWEHRGYIEFRDDIYDCHVAVTKTDDHLHFDLTHTADQAPAVINCTVHGLIGSVLASTMVYLCWDIPWSPGGVSRVLSVESRHGTVVHAAHPAGVSKATTTAIWEVRNLCSIAIGKMLAASETHRDRAMAGWQGVKAVEEIFGQDREGIPFGGPMLDGMAGGGGALCFQDGIDTGGHTSSLRSTIADVESYELRYPLLYLERRQNPDSGGPGKFRGGVGVTITYTVHGVDEIPTKIMHTFGVEQPESPGLCGGYPSTTNQFAIMRDSNLAERFAAGVMPSSLEELEGTLEIYGAYKTTTMRAGDVYRAVSMGGGGYGDPIDRDPEAVRHDVRESLVTAEWARRTYGVILADGGRAVDAEATRARRDEIRAERRDASQVAARPVEGGPWSPAGDGFRHSESLFYDLSGGDARLRCRCGHVLGPADAPFKDLTASARFPVQRIGPDVNPNHIGGARFELREFYCPACSTLLAADICRPEDPTLDDARISLEWLRAQAAPEGQVR
jgi:N-methylhydantoinase B